MIANRWSAPTKQATPCPQCFATAMQATRLPLQFLLHPALC